MGPALTLSLPLLHKQCSEHAISLIMQPIARQLGETESGQRDKELTEIQSQHQHQKKKNELPTYSLLPLLWHLFGI